MARRLYEHEDDERHKVYAERIIKSVERLERMLLRIDEYKLILSSTLVVGDLNDVIEAAVTDARELMEGRDINIDVKLMPDPPHVRLDYGNLKTAILNVLENSIEAIEEKGTITVETMPTSDDTILLKIIDTGCGIGADELRNIFNPFHTLKMEGAGMGLTITYRIIHDHGGEIEAESTKGEGTTVMIWFHPSTAAEHVPGAAAAGASD
jgi:signal transduction histidine kinase